MQSHEAIDKYGFWTPKASPQQKSGATDQERYPENPPAPPRKPAAMAAASNEPGTEYWLP